MSADQMAELMRAASADGAIAAAFAAASTPQEMVEVAAGLGYDISVDDLSAAATEMGSRELSDHELDPVAGGGGFSYSPTCMLNTCGCPGS